PFPAGHGSIGVASDPAGKFLFAANLQDDTLSAFTIDASTGALTPVAGSPFSTHSAPVDVQVDPFGEVRLRRELGFRRPVGFCSRYNNRSARSHLGIAVLYWTASAWWSGDREDPVKQGRSED